MYCPENFKRGTADRAQEKAAGPEHPRVLAPEPRTELVQKRGSGLAFECSDGLAQHDGRGMAMQEMQSASPPDSIKSAKKCYKALDFKRYAPKMANTRRIYSVPHKSEA